MIALYIQVVPPPVPPPPPPGLTTDNYLTIVLVMAIIYGCHILNLKERKIIKK